MVSLSLKELVNNVIYYYYIYAYDRERECRYNENCIREISGNRIIQFYSVIELQYISYDIIHSVE